MLAALSHVTVAAPTILLSPPSAGLGDEHSVRMYQVDATDKKSLAEVWHVPHVFTRERGRCLKCSGSQPAYSVQLLA